jgi:hypothetical protein
VSSEFNVNTFCVYLLKSFGPFVDTAENFANSMNDASEYNIEILPDGDGNIKISIIDYREVPEDERVNQAVATDS